MMRESEVLAAAVYVDGLAQVLLGHCGALDVPARSSHAPWRLPCDLGFFLASLPESEVQRIFLHLADSDARAALEVVDVLAGQLAVLFKLTCRVVDVAVCLVGVALVDEGLHEFDDLRDVLRDLRVNVGLDDVESLCVVEVLLDVLLGDLRRRDALFFRAVDDLVVNIGEVLHEFDLVASVLEVPSECVEHYERPCVSYMKEVVDRRAADVHSYLAGLDRYKFLFAVCECVIDLHVSSCLFSN